MLEAVQTIHEEKIVHSDLKPANFVLVKGSLKLIDFGIAKTIANNRTNIQRKHQVGILNYMSPESIEETQTANGRRLKLGHASDVWSPGCILYQMIYSQPPFCSITGTVPKLRAISNPNRIINYPTKPVPTVPASDKEGARQILEWATPVPLDVVNTLKGCLTRDPKQQNTTASQLKVPKLKESEVILTEAWMKQIIKHASKEAIENGALDEEAVQKIAQGPWGLRSTSEPLGSQPGLVILLLSLPGSGVLHKHSGAHCKHTRSPVSGSRTLTKDYESMMNTKHPAYCKFC
ncbi:serine/threonine-protein kinase TTK/MPS1 [Rhizoctonia solani AG-1 IB]|uniref:Serine/threonine-protein kinase TTK/MPS1 n=1 Tax=Thanatephorus cucumeris (strain AG1-IB / isolate 7/3/14) TaxID=1108050 RepID=M5CGJ2_THACB|nr:serine/threonine-protein kinase TTK/MPS1 [Rhizoctonia solani AG-1 IB]